MTSSSITTATEGAPKSELPPAKVNEFAPVFCPVDEWCRLSGLSRAATYQALKEGWLPSIKLRKTRLIDFHPAIAAVREKFGTSQAA
jgi:hypothetical protein